MKALLRFTPVFDPRMVDDPRLARERVVQRGALEQANPNEPIPVVVDHDMSRQIGTVRQLFVAPDVNGRVVQDWWFALCDLTDAADGWVKRGGAVSWKHIPLREQAVGETTRLLRGVIREVSILAPGTEPVEPLARVMYVEHTDSPAAGVTSDRPVAGEVIYGRGQRIVRPGIGQVLGVR